MERPSTPKRTDIQGLRAIAVVAVVLSHLFGQPSGGYIGVDIFYVISGFLITSLLLTERRASARISFGAFYRRRAFRILPAAAVVLLVTVGAGFAILYLPRAQQIGVDAFAAAFFSENWHLMAVGANYLQSEGPPSPLQHYWSLSVEEQFYAIWPLLIALVPVRWLHERGRTFLWLLLILTAASLAWAAFRTMTDPAAAYFDSVARAWELFVGALLVFVPRGGPRLVRATAQYAGLATIVAGVLLLDEKSPFPFPSALAPVLGAAAIIWAGNAGTPPFSPVLSNAVSQYLGRISYSLYLWHFPVLIYFLAVVPDASLVDRLGLVAASVVLADVTYRLVERPFIALGRRRGTGGRRARNARPVRQRLLLPLGILVCLLAISAAELRGPLILRSAAAARTDIPVPTATARFTSNAGVESAVAAAAASTRWPADLSPSLDDLTPAQEAPAMGQVSPGCRNAVADTGTPLVCTYGTVTGYHSTVMVVGDSIALSWTPAITAALTDQQVRVIAIGYASCALIDARTTDSTNDPDLPAACARSRATMMQRVVAYHPQVLILSSDESAYGRLSSGATGIRAQAEWSAATSRTLALVRPHVGRTVVLSNPPDAADPTSCLSRIGGPRACLTAVSAAYTAKTSAETDAVNRARSQNQNAMYVDTRSWFCTVAGCPAYVRTVPVRFDLEHLTRQYAEALGPLMRKAIGSDFLAG